MRRTRGLSSEAFKRVGDEGVGKIVVREVMCKSVLCRSRISGVDYAVNPYLGCVHKCVYCYARFMKRFSGRLESWGDFVDVKVNASHVLAKSLCRARRGLVCLSTVTDPYQPLERRYELTRSCLQRLLVHQFPVDILTKSSLVLRDMDLLSKLRECEVGFTITTVDDEVRSKFELRSSSSEERLAALEELHDHGISTYVFLGPILPHVTDGEADLRNLIHRLAKAEVGCVTVDRLNMRWGVWPSMVAFLMKHYPELLPEYRRIFWSRSSYFDTVKTRIQRLCNEYGLRCEFCF